jgi:hypothetical protein
MQGHRRDEHPTRHELRHELRREGPAGARHLGAPGLEGKNSLVRVERPQLGDVGVSDRPPVPPKVVLDRLLELESCDGESTSAGESCKQLGLDTTGELDASAQRRSRVVSTVARPQLNEPGAVGCRRREPELQRLLADAGVERGRQRCRGVNDKQVAGG